MTISPSGVRTEDWKRVSEEAFSISAFSRNSVAIGSCGDMARAYEDISEIYLSPWKARINYLMQTDDRIPGPPQLQLSKSDSGIYA